MPRSRAPQNSASSCHQRLFSDLQTVYKKIIQTNGASFPFRAKDSRQPLHTAFTNCKSRPLTVSNSVFSSRTPSACSSVEEIIIKPLQFHERLAYTSCGSRCHTHSPLQFNCRPRSELDSSEICNESLRALSTPDTPIEYSEQSIRYVTEQVSLEQARQLKLRSNIKQHRVDRRYFVSGSKMHLQKQAFEETPENVLQLNGEKRNFATKARHYSRFRPPVIKHGNRGDLKVTDTDGICGVSIQQDSHFTSNTEEASTVAIPTALNHRASQSSHTADNVEMQSSVSTEPPSAD